MRHGLLGGIFLACLAAAWALTPDATREQVIEELGKPGSVAKLGGREIMIYPKGVRIELEGGKVVATKGIALSDAVVAPEPPAVAKPVQKKENKPALTEKQQKPTVAGKDAAEPDYTPAAAMDKAVEGMEKSHEQDQHPPLPKKFSVTGFVLGMILKFLLTVAALKLACKYWGAEVFWSALFTVSGADVLVRAAMELIGELLLGFPTLFMADELVAGIVMLFLLKKLSVNHAIGQAAQLTLTTKTFSVVVGSFLITVILRLLN